jgi:hypothetical protein
VNRIKEGEGVMLVGSKTVNRIIDAINALQKIQVNPSSAGKFIVGDDAAVLDLKALGDRITTIENHFAAGGDIQTLQTAVSNLQSAMSGASISAVCNGDGTITVTLTWGGGGGS